MSQVHPIDKSESKSASMLFDGLSATGFKGKLNSRNNGIHKIKLDLGKEYTVNMINYIPYTKSMMQEGSTYKLYYWDNGWKFHSLMSGNNSMLCFEAVPMGTLFRIETEEIKSQQNMERIFLYEDGIVRWM